MVFAFCLLPAWRILKPWSWLEQLAIIEQTEKRKERKKRERPNKWYPTIWWVKNALISHGPCACHGRIPAVSLSPYPRKKCSGETESQGERPRGTAKRAGTEGSYNKSAGHVSLIWWKFTCWRSFSGVPKESTNVPLEGITMANYITPVI